MERFTERPVRILGGLLLAAACAFGQAYTISAKPGAVNYIEGSASVNGNPVADRNLKNTFLNANDTFSTTTGKAEILLTPGVFLRVGENTEVRMISPSLTDTKVEVLSGEVMLEASGLVKDNNLQILDHGAVITITKNGLYKFTADSPPTAAVLEGKARVSLNDGKVDLKKGRETILAANLKAEKFDSKKEDELYAWSNVRSEYEAAASYRVSQNASLGVFPGAYGGFGSGFGPGWYWDNGFNSYAWLPGNGAFYSPFGYGFYGPGLVGYAPVINTSIYRGGRPWHGRGGNAVLPGTGVTAPVPVSPRNPPAIGSTSSSPWADRQARREAYRAAYAAANNGAAPPPGSWRNANGAGANQGGWHGGQGAAGVPPTGTPGGGWHGGGNGAGGWHGGGNGAGGWHGGGNGAGGWHGGGPGGAGGGGFNGGAAGHMGGASGAGGGHAGGSGGGARSK